MMTAAVALREFVTSPLIHRQWRWAMVSIDAHKWVTSVCAVAAAAIVIATQVFGAGGLLTGQSKDIQQLQAQQNSISSQYTLLATQLTALQAQVAPLAQLSLQLDKMTQRFEQVPRADMLNSQLMEIQRHLSSLDGRMDGMDTRARTDEDRIIRSDTRLDSIERASKEPLGSNHH